MTPALRAALAVLRCPVCGEPLADDGAGLGCASGHRYDVARQGYVNLAVGRHHGTGDTAAMVEARERFLGAGHYDAVTAAVRDLLPAGEGPVVDVGGGTGHHLAGALPEGRFGICLDLSVAALRRAARIHPRVAAAGVDAWRGLPIADGAAGAVLSVFAPRNPAETRRVLAPGGAWVTVTPAPAHLQEAVAAFGLIGVAPDKEERLAAGLAGFTTTAARDLGYRLDLDAAAVRDLVLMGPNAHHVDAFEARPLTVTVAVRLALHTRD